MQLVAASKMRQFQRRAVSVRHYVWNLLEILENNIDAKVKSSYNETRKEGATLFVLYTSDKGLCGPLNTKLINGLFRSSNWLDLPEKERLLVTIGKKSTDFARRNEIPVALSYPGLPEKPSNLDVIEIVDSILKMWNAGTVRKVVLVAPHYKNSFTFYPVLKTFLPFTQETIDTALDHLDVNERPKMQKPRTDYMLFEPSLEHVLKRLYEQMIESLFFQSFLELKASEYSSRMIAMQNATDAADRMANDLTRHYNKARQQVITSEIAELVGASEAITS